MKLGPAPMIRPERPPPKSLSVRPFIIIAILLDVLNATYGAVTLVKPADDKHSSFGYRSYAWTLGFVYGLYFFIPISLIIFAIFKVRTRARR